MESASVAGDHPAESSDKGLKKNDDRISRRSVDRPCLHRSGVVAIPILFAVVAIVTPGTRSETR